MIKKVARFEKVSFVQYYQDLVDLYEEYLPDGYLLTQQYAYGIWKQILHPSRATLGSAEHDFFSPFSFNLECGQAITIPTGIKCSIRTGWFLSAFPRSSIGFKSGVSLANTVGIIDSDYYDNTDNEGHIFIKLTNNNQAIMKDISVNKGDAFCQGIFLPYGVTSDDVVIEVRVGGVGSTNTRAQSKVIDCDMPKFKFPSRVPHLAS